MLTYGPLEEIEVGGYCSIANEVRLLCPGGRVFDADGNDLELDIRGNHRPESASTFPIGILVPDEPYDEAPPGTTGERLVIGDDVWIGHGASVIGHLTVGTGAVVGPGALVRADVPPYAVVGGVPARVIRYRFDEATIARLLRLRWWDWSPELVKATHRWFRRPIGEFLAHFDPAGEPTPADASA